MSADPRLPKISIFYGPAGSGKTTATRTLGAKYLRSIEELANLSPEDSVVAFGGLPSGNGIGAILLYLIPFKIIVETEKGRQEKGHLWPTHAKHIIFETRYDPRVREDAYPDKEDDPTTPLGLFLPFVQEFRQFP
jgi:hypothetical protein